jgi:hypothetical protein
MLTLPSQTCALSKRLFHDGRSVYKDLHVAMKYSRCELRQMLQTALEHLVVVSIASIDGNVPGRSFCQVFKRIRIRCVVKAYHYDALDIWPQTVGLTSLRRSIGKPSHAPMISRVNEGDQSRAGVFRKFGVAKANCIEPQT